MYLHSSRAKLSGGNYVPDRLFNKFWISTYSDNGLSSASAAVNMGRQCDIEY